VAVEFAQINRLIDRVAPRPSRLVASGAALLGSRVWMQMMADATGRRLMATTVKEASSRGAALHVLDRLGLLRPADPARGAGTVFLPDAAAGKGFKRLEQRQQSLYRALITDRVLDPLGASGRQDLLSPGSC
jgi:gluconokinase